MNSLLNECIVVLRDAKSHWMDLLWQLRAAQIPLVIRVLRATDHTLNAIVETLKGSSTDAVLEALNDLAGAMNDLAMNEAGPFQKAFFHSRLGLLQWCALITEQERLEHEFHDTDTSDFPKREEIGKLLN